MAMSSILSNLGGFMGNTCSLLSLIGLQLVLIVCEGGLCLSPERSSQSEVTVGKSML